MGKVTGFKEYNRKIGIYKPVNERIKNYNDIYVPLEENEVQKQAARCMDCGVPFCSYSCPLGNIIPDFNDLIYNGQWKKALQVLHITNNFPEFTSKVCPAPCESGCVLGINQSPVTIKQMELALVEKGWKEGWIRAQPPAVRTGKKVAIIGSGPSGLAAAQQLARVGHSVTVFEREDEIGGLLRYGIPDFKLSKSLISNRTKQMKKEGVIFKTNSNVGVNIDIADLKEEFDVLCLTGGSTEPRDLMVSGRELDGIHFAMEFLPQQNKRNAGKEISSNKSIYAEGKNVIVIGGGDTGSDCVGTSIRQGAKNVTQLELLPMPPTERTEDCPWPTYPMILRTSTSQEEAKEIFGNDPRQYSIATKSFSGNNGKVDKLHCAKLNWKKGSDGKMKMEEIKDSGFTLNADLVLFAMGFLHPEHHGMLDTLGVEYDGRGNVLTDENYMTSIKGIFSAGDMRRGQSLVVHAISEGRKVAKQIDEYLMGETFLQSVL